MPEYLIRLSVRTEREPREDPWPWLVKIGEAMFKTRPPGLTLEMLGATVEMVTPGMHAPPVPPVDSPLPGTSPD